MEGEAHGDVERELAWLVLVEKGSPVGRHSGVVHILSLREMTLVLAIKVLDVLTIKPGW